jgi:hypothetical protein
MQRGSLALVSREEGPAVWQFHCPRRICMEFVSHGKECLARFSAARTSLLSVPRWPSSWRNSIRGRQARISSGSITVAQLCDHFEQRELAKDNTWRSYSTRKRRTARVFLTPAEVKALVHSSGLRERTLVLLARIHRIAAERDVRVEVGRHRLHPRDHERHALHRVRSSRSVPDRIIAEALATSRGSRDALLDWKIRPPTPSPTIGFSRASVAEVEDLTGPGDLAQIYVVNVGRSQPDSYAGEACSASGRGVSGLLSTKRHKTCPFCAFDGFAEISVCYLE